jgi:tetratricopeptide (TPR) repeat protein
MTISWARMTILMLLCCTGATICRAQTVPPAPLRAAELLSLVAGRALPENVVRDLATAGLAFRPDAPYRALLKTAGADPKILAALDNAKVFVQRNPEADAGKDVLQHLANAGNFLNADRYAEATRDLTAVLTSDPGSPECAFVMGQVLRKEEQWVGAEAVYEQLLRQAPDFRAAHAKLSYILYRMQDIEKSLTEAKAALRQAPDDAEAHKNAGLALASMRKYDAADAEYREALRLKPDYAAVHLNLALMFGDRGDWDNAIAENKKATHLTPNDSGAFYDLGYTLDQKGDFESAIRAYREAKRLDPRRYDARQNLGAALMNHGQAAEAVAEFRELVKLYPNTEMCVFSLGQGLFLMSNFEEAVPQFHLAAKLDPSDPKPHINLGAILEEQKQDDAALKEYALALNLDNTDADAHRAMGRVLLRKKEVPQAIDELKQAAELRPADASIHDFYGKALEASGDFQGAIGEFRQAASLDPRQIQYMLELASALEKKADWVAAMDEYRSAAAQDASSDLRGKVRRGDDRHPQREYLDAQQRLDSHLTALKSAGKSSEAISLQKRINATRGAAGLSEQLDEAMQAAAEADKVRHFDEALRHYLEAVQIAEKLPHDMRLVTALDHVGNHYLGQNPVGAQTAYERELKTAQELFGAQSSNLTGPLQSLGRNALFQKDYAAAEKFFFRAVDINEKVYGEGSNKVAESLVQASMVYFAQKDYAKQEPYVLRAVRIDEALYGADNIGMLIPRSTLCALYDHWEKPDKAVACYQTLLTVLEKQYGAKSPGLVVALTSEAQALRKLDRSQEADQVDQRIALIRAATMASN